MKKKILALCILGLCITVFASIKALAQEAYVSSDDTTALTTIIATTTYDDIQDMEDASDYEYYPYMNFTLDADSIARDSDGYADDGSIANSSFTANERVEFITETVTVTLYKS